MSITTLHEARNTNDKKYYLERITYGQLIHSLIILSIEMHSPCLRIALVSFVDDSYVSY